MPNDKCLEDCREKNAPAQVEPQDRGLTTEPKHTEAKPLPPLVAVE